MEFLRKFKTLGSLSLISLFVLSMGLSACGSKSNEAKEEPAAVEEKSEHPSEHPSDSEHPHEHPGDDEDEEDENEDE
ncbi:MAG TPA: hypothetical protein PKC24_09895 [Cyclobacteriaceae bacterium]|nr:hypothetical protein [Cyclobacteriaceae bacterium]